MKKFMAVMLSCAMLIAAFASTAVLAASAEAPITITAQSVSGVAVGDIITVDVSVSENHYMVNGQIWVEYDPNALEIQTVWEDEENPYFEDVNSEIIKGTYFWAFAVSKPGLGKFAFATSASKGTTAGGTIFTLTFKVLEGIGNGTAVNVTVPETSINDGVQNGGADLIVVPVCVNGTVTPAGVWLEGDVDLDGDVDAADALALFEYVNGQTELSAEALAVADVTGDGVIGLADAVRVFYIASGLI